MDEDIEKSLRITELATSRIPEAGLSEMNINDYVASLTNLSHLPNAPKNESRNLQRAAGLYSYLRDNLRVKTVAEARLGLTQRRIDPKVIRVWVEEEMAINPGEFDAILEGYPEYKEDLERVRKQYLDIQLKKPE